MSEQQVKQQKPKAVPEKSMDAAQKINHQTQSPTDPYDQMTMMLTMSITILMRFDPIALWGVWFIMVSLSINRGSQGTIFSQCLIVSVIVLIFIGIQYWNITRGAIPPPAKWNLF